MIVAAPVGIIGLGNMGSALASNLVQAELTVVAYDARGPETAPDGTSHAAHVADVARQCDIVVLSLPDSVACEQVARELSATEGRSVTHVVDTSTIGVHAARTMSEGLVEHGMAYVDAPVSGGPAGARARTLMVMYAANDDACRHVEPVLAALSDRRHRVGDRPGLGQAMKLANNFLSATALVATSEAIAFGMSLGLDMETMLQVLNASSGHNTATADKFPNHVLTERYASGFTNLLMAKDLALFLEAVEEQGTPTPMGALAASTWARFAAAEPGADFTRIFPFVRRP